VRDTAEQLLDVMFTKEKAKSFSQFSTAMDRHELDLKKISGALSIQNYDLERFPIFFILYCQSWD
jgi:hypothetical protein